MAYGNGNNAQRNNGGNYGKGTGAGNRPAAAVAPKAGAQDDVREEPIISKFLRATKSGKSIAFLTGEKDLVIPANTRVVVTPLSEKRTEALTKSAKEKGYTASVPTHELTVFPVEIRQAK